jgi:aspartate kinase
MLGRNSSDLTAVALAGALNLEACEIYSDVPGVYSADPYVFPNARLLNTLPHSQLIEMSRSGAKVIHFGAAECAQRMQVQIHCRATAQPDGVGTIVARDSRTAPAVVLNEKACFFEFDSRHDLEMAEGRLSAWGVAAVRIDPDDSLVLAVTQGVLSVAEYLRTLSVTFRQIPHRGLITVMHESGDVERIVADQNVVRTLARQYHDQVCASHRSTPDRLPAAVLAGSGSVDAPTESDLLPWMTSHES